MMRTRLLGIAAAVALLAGCSTTVSGTVAKTTVAAPAGAIDLALLDPGNYPTKPRPPLGQAGDINHGAMLEGVRMGVNVLGPWQVDPTLTAYGQGGHRPSDFAMPFSVAAANTANDDKLVAIFTSARSSTAGNSELVNSVLRFPSPEDAAKAAADITAASIDSEVFGTVVHHDPIPIPRHPESSGLVHFWDTQGKWAVEAFTAHGPYVLAQYAASTDNADTAAGLIATALDQQAPLIDQFKPTPIDQLKDLPIDPDGVLAHTLAPDDSDGIVYPPQAQLHLDSDPVGSQKLFNDAHLQQVAKGRVNVYATPDAASAQKIVNGFADYVAKNGMASMKFGPAAEIKGLPGSKCLTHKGTTGNDSMFYCLVVADRYAIEVSAAQERDAHQQVSAQYLMLTAK